MKKYILLISSAIIVTFLAGCGDNFIDSDSNAYVTNERKLELIKDPVVLKNISTASLASSYIVFQDAWSSHDDFGLRAYQLASDLMCEDMTMSKGGWFQFDAQADNHQAPYRRTHSTWRFLYKIISNANLVLYEYFNTESTDTDVLALKAEPMAMRGIAYFYLVNAYQHTYVGNESALGVPLMLNPMDGNLARSTVKEVYEQIISDLTFAVEHGVATDIRTDIDKAVAAAYLAKVYAQMENWAKVEEYAVIAQTGGVDKVTTTGRAFAIGDEDVLWGNDVNATTSTLYASFPSHMDYTCPKGYARNGVHKLIHNLLYEKIPVGDSRRSLWLNASEFPEIFNKYKAYGAMDYDQAKFLTSVGFEADYIYIRVQDPILLEIEALIEQNKLSDAKTKLTAFVKKRYPAFVTPDTQAELREEVRFQRRIELWGEGTNLHDMKRWKLSINRLDPNTNHLYKFSASISDARYRYEIPQQEIEANPLLEQNK